ncbi:RHS repeat-associated core domain-containing protein [Comamonadaceae bacterium OH3737_COT-264]|nr:RHS repeat-associated core domain-containing protein [Comamonadaceae bacterium OH3737_COT-264]
MSKTTGQGAQQTTTWYLYSDEGLVKEINAAGQTTKSYGWQADSGWGTAPLWQTEHNNSAQGQAQTQTHWLHTDHLERPLVASDSSGAATWQALAESFGQTWVNSTSRTEVNIRLPGQYWDAESGRHYNQQRYYDPQTGRYMQSDPLGLYDGINTYGYAYQNPLSYSDPTGEAVPAIVWSYARCVAKCKVSDALRAAIQSECDPRTLGDCALECLNPFRWLGNKFNKAIPKPAKGKGSVAPAQRDKKRVWSKEENKKKA